MWAGFEQGHRKILKLDWRFVSISNSNIDMNLILWKCKTHLTTRICKSLCHKSQWRYLFDKWLRGKFQNRFESILNQSLQMSGWSESKVILRFLKQQNKDKEEKTKKNFMAKRNLIVITFSRIKWKKFCQNIPILHFLTLHIKLIVTANINGLPQTLLYNFCGSPSFFLYWYIKGQSSQEDNKT